jgi:copper(I)-binding protein
MSHVAEKLQAIRNSTSDGAAVIELHQRVLPQSMNNMAQIS